MSGIGPELEGKRLELLRALPRLSRVAYLAYGSDPAHRLFVKETQDAAARLGIQVQPLVLGSVEEIDRAFATMRSEQAEALIVQPLFVENLGQGQRIADLAIQRRLPTVSHAYSFAQVGGLMSCAGCSCIASARRHLRGQDPQRRQTGRPARGAAHDVQVEHQSQDCKGARPGSATNAARYRRRGDRMKRREFLNLLGLVVTWRLTAYAQQAGKVPRIGYLALRASPSAETRHSSKGCASSAGSRARILPSSIGGPP